MQQNHINLVTAIASAILGVSSLIAAELPAEYRRVDYVETQGNQWIDTGYYPGPQTIVEGDVKMVGAFNPSEGGVPFGAQDADSYFRANYANGNADRFLLRFGPTTLNPNYTDLYGAAAVNGKRVKIGFDANTKTFFYGSVNGTVSAALERTLTTPLGIGGVIKNVGDPVLFDCFSMRIYGWKIWTGATLERDYVPCVRKQDNVAGLYDLQNGEFKPSAGDPFAVRVELPAEYGRVDYVETQGNQWIDTGYYPGPRTIVEGDVQMVGAFNPSEGGVPFGAQDADSYFRVNYANNNADRFLLRFGPTTLNPNYTDLYGAAAVNGKRVKIGFDANTKTFFYGSVNGTFGAALEKTLTTPLGIGGVIKNVGDPVLFDCFSMRIYGWEIWTGTTLERDYVPCVRKQDNVAGLYDLRNGVFKPSAADPFAVPVELPAGYAIADYVETRGNQWIDTGYYPGPQTVFEGDVQMVAGTYTPGSAVVTNFIPFGALNYDPVESFRLNISNMKSDQFIFWCYTGTQPSSAGADINGADQHNGRRTKLTFDAITKKFTYGSLSRIIENEIPNEPLKVTFGIGGAIQTPRPPRPLQCFNMRIYGWKIWTGEKLERDYVPCVREEDNVAGLYDVQNGVFKPSAGDPFVAAGGKIKSVLEFSGKAATDCITFDYRPSLGNFSASAWVKNVTPGSQDASGTYVGVIFSQGAQGANPGFACTVSSKPGETYSLNCQVRRSLEDFKSVTTDWTAHAKDGKWHLVTVTYDKSSGLCCLYVDAEFKNSITQSTLTPISEQRFCIGARAEGISTGFPVKGNVAEVSLWDRVLKPEEIKRMLYRQLNGKERGLLGYWPLTGPCDDLTANGPVDCVDNGNTRHDGTYGTGVNVIGGKVGFWPKPGMALLLY